VSQEQPSSHAKRSSCLRTVIVGIVIVALCYVLVTALSSVILRNVKLDPLSAYSYQAVPTNTYELSAIEGNAEIKLPSSAREIYAYTSGFQDIFIMVRFTVDPEELSEFMKNALCTESLRQVSPQRQEKLSGDPSWWELARAEHLESCSGVKEYSSTQQCKQTIFVDKTNPENYIIYVSTSCH
jgi:hypothetical protein